MTQTEILQIVTGFLGTLGFTILFNIKGKRLVMTALGGFMSWALFVLLGYLINSEPIRYFIVSISISVYAEIIARVLKTPTTTVLMTALVPLVPGGALYYTMSNALAGNVDAFWEKGIYTLQLSGALALGIVITTTVARVLNRCGKKKV